MKIFYFIDNNALITNFKDTHTPWQTFKLSPSTKVIFQQNYWNDQAIDKFKWLYDQFELQIFN